MRHQRDSGRTDGWNIYWRELPPFRTQTDRTAQIMFPRQADETADEGMKTVEAYIIKQLD